MKTPKACIKVERRVLRDEGKEGWEGGREVNFLPVSRCQLQYMLSCFQQSDMSIEFVLL